MAIWDNNVRTTLNTGISSATAMTGAGTVVVDAASAPYLDFPDPSGETAYFVIIDSLSSPTKFEIFTYTSLTDNTTTFDLGGVTRAVDGTSAQDFSVGAVVLQDLTAEYLSLLARNWAYLGVVSSTEVM